MLHRLSHTLDVSLRRVFYKNKQTNKQHHMEGKLIIIFLGVGYIFLCLPTYNSNFRHVQAKYLVHYTSNLQHYIVLSNSLDPERVRR